MVKFEPSLRRLPSRKLNTRSILDVHSTIQCRQHMKSLNLIAEKCELLLLVECVVNVALIVVEIVQRRVILNKSSRKKVLLWNVPI